MLERRSAIERTRSAELKARKPGRSQREAADDGFLVVGIRGAGALPRLVEDAEVILGELVQTIRRHTDVANAAQSARARSLADEEGPLDCLDLRRRNRALVRQGHDLLADVDPRLAIHGVRERRVLQDPRSLIDGGI